MLAGRGFSASCAVSMNDPTNFPATQLYTDVQTGELRERQFRVSIVQGPDKGLERVLETGTTLVGTHPRTTRSERSRP